jgi:hypothetical protein
VPLAAAFRVCWYFQSTARHDSPMHLTKVSGTLRIVTGLVICSAVIWSGYQRQSPWILPAMALAFTAAYVAGRLWVWRLLLGKEELFRALISTPLTLLVQGILVTILYFIGLGVAALFAPQGAVKAFVFGDLQVPLAVGLFGVVAGLLIDGIERRAAEGARKNDAVAAGEDFRPEISVSSDAIDPARLFTGVHHAHMSFGPGAADGNRTYDPSPNEQSAGSDAKIEAAEKRLGVAFPEELRALYRFQNGGSVRNVCIVKPGVENPSRFEDVILPFLGYEELYPTEVLRTVQEAICDYADPSETEEFPEGCERMIVLAQWYRETLFLDYRTGGMPSVNIADWDDSDWPARLHSWPDFATFFAALRRFNV